MEETLKSQTINLNDVIVDSIQNFLIIDDDGDIRSLLQDFLETIGFNGKILLAESLHEAKKHLKYEKVNYILSDWNLPDGQGISLLKAIRKSPKFNDIPFMMITGQSDIESMITSSRLGSSEYLTKPFSLQDFQSKLTEGWKTHILPKKEEVYQLKKRIIQLEEENELLKEKIDQVLYQRD